MGRFSCREAGRPLGRTVYSSEVSLRDRVKRVSMTPPQEARPRRAAYLVGAGGVAVLLEGLLTGNILMLLVGFFLLVAAVLVHGEPHHHVANGMLSLLLVFLSLVFGLGGFYIGAILAAAGGILAIVWSPPKPVVQSKVAPQSAPFQTG